MENTLEYLKEDRNKLLAVKNKYEKAMTAQQGAEKIYEVIISKTDPLFEPPNPWTKDQNGGGFGCCN